MPDGIEENKTDGGGLTHRADVVGDCKDSDWRKPVKAAVVTTAGAGVGVIGAIAGVAMTAAILEVALPVTLCVWAGGITCGAIGLALGIKDKPLNGNTERRAHAGKS